MKKFFFILVLLSFCRLSLTGDVIRVGSKKFTESYVLAEIMAQLIENELHLTVERKFGLGGTFVAFEALRTGAIDIYPEYSGTALEVLLKTKEDLDFSGMNRRLRERDGLEWLEPFGFNNSYALAMPRQMEHTLSYEALANGSADVMDVYTTDAKVITYDLFVLEDDRRFFPHYFGAPLVRSKILVKYPKLKVVLNRLAGTITDKEMRALNNAAEIDGKSFAQVAREFLQKEERVADKKISWLLLWQRTAQHLKLTFLSVFFASVLGIPLAILMRKIPPPCPPSSLHHGHCADDPLHRLAGPHDPVLWDWRVTGADGTLYLWTAADCAQHLCCFKRDQPCDFGGRRWNRFATL